MPHAIPDFHGKKTCAIIVAAGRGHRFGKNDLKQYMKVDGEYVLKKALFPFISHPDINLIQVVIHPDDQHMYERATEGLQILPPVYGGRERQESVCAGLKAVEPYKPQYVLVHDAARPFVSLPLVQKVLKTLHHAPGAIPALPVTDTLKKGNKGLIEKTIDRDQIWAAQTPQGFHFTELLAAHTACQEQHSFDDAHIMEHAGYGPVVIVEGDPENRKITRPDDLSSDKPQQKDSMPCETRTGMGFDIHAFCEGNHVILCGINIPCAKSLSGHSDADVALHALCDALYGSIGANDIGDHFPPSDPQWKNSSSWVFVDHARDMIHKNKGRITNVDITIICEDPKIGPYRSAMREAVASRLRIDASRVNVKATTTERRGALGRKEGIAAQAVATISLPYQTA